MQTMIRPISCEHKLSDEITSLDDGEIICGHCGMVKGRSDITIHSSSSKSNLFLDTEIGSKPNTSFNSSKYVHSQNSKLTEISNICRTLDIPNFINNDIWFWYNRIKSNIKITKAKILVVICYQMCRYHAFPINESQLLDVVKAQLRVKHIHTSLEVLCEIYSFLDDKGIPIIEKIGFAQLTTHDVTFLLRSKIKTLNDKYSAETVVLVNEIALGVLKGLSGTDEDRAKMAFGIAKTRCGIC